MGNQQAGSCPNSAANSTTNLAAVVRKSARNSRHRMAELWEMRRRSVGIAALDAIKREEDSSHNNYRSFTYGQSPAHSSDEAASSSEELAKKQVVPPRIQINGINNEKKEGSPAETEHEHNCNGGVNGIDKDDQILKPLKIATEQRRGSGTSLPSYSKHRAQKVDSRKIVARKRLERGHTTTNASSNGALYAKNSKSNGQQRHPLMASLRASDLAHSLDANVKYSTDKICLEMKPLRCSSSRSVSPLLHQQRRFGSSGGIHHHRGSLLSGSFSGDEGVLSKEQSDAIQQSWQLAKERIRQFAGNDRCFGFFAFDRIFERAPELKPMFGISPNMSLLDIDEQQEMHPFTRHSRIFNNILDLAVRNAAELETEILPALFTYGQRHYRPKIEDQFNERTVRLFCNQVVGTMCDLLDQELSPFAQEAWIEMVTFLGRALISGFEHERQKNGNKRFSLHKM